MLNTIKDLLTTFKPNKNGESVCFLDNDLHCITHGWYNSEIECPHKRAKEFLASKKGEF